MARRVFIILFSLSFAGQNFAVSQEFQKKPKKHFLLPEQASQSDCRPGTINIKLKPEFRNLFNNPQQLKARLSKIYNELGFERLKPIISEDRQQRNNARLKRNPVYDLGLYQTLSYSSDVPVEEAINMLYETGIVEFAEPEYIQKIDLTPDDSLMARQYHLDLIKAFDAWDITTGDTTIIIAIVDSGIDVDHPDLNGNLWINPDDPVDGIDNDGNGYIDDIHGWDFAGSLSEDPDDEDNDVDITKGGGHQHGLGVASVAGATTNNGIGFAGTGFNCRIMATKHFADNQPEDAVQYASDPYLGIIYAAENGADIINCSWGSTFRSQFNQDLISYVSVDLGALVVASSGNSGLEEAHYPSDYKYVLSVSAVNRNLTKTSFTTYGKGVDISALGSAIAVHENDGVYGVTQGTSFSAPMVAGAAGLVKSLYPDFNGIQTGELLRVTANDTIYDINPESIYKNKLGKGLLDMNKALTSQPPSIRLLSYKLLNEVGKTPGPGEEAFFIANFTNYLWPSSNGLTVNLTSGSEFLEVLDDISDLGKIEMEQVITNAAHPFRVRIGEDIPTNLKINLLLDYEDGEYVDYQYISILLNPTFLNIEENQVTSSIAENGRIGYQDNEQREGLGFIFDSKNNLYEMGLMLGNSEAQVSSSVRSSIQGSYDKDFVSTKRIDSKSPGDYSAAEIFGEFNDSDAGNSASNVLINYRTMVWKEAPDNKYFIVEYIIQYEGDSTLNSFYAGLYADWDIKGGSNGNGSEDRADWNDSTSMGYVYNTDSTEQYFHGIQVLRGSANYWAIDNDETLTDNPWGVYDGFEDLEKYEAMSSGIGRQQAGFGDADGDDVSHTVAAGPFVIDPGDSIKVAFAIHGAATLEDLITSAQAADTMYNYTLQEPTPVLNDVEVCYEDSAVISASGASTYKWYKTKTGGEPFFEGDEYTTINLFNDTTYYISNAENPWESVRTAVSIFAMANPTIILSGSQFLCDGDTTTLLVAEADSYFWNPGNESTQTIDVSQTGLYSVTVTYDSLGCVSTSPEINIIKNDLPTASFVLDKYEIIQNVDTEINMTDLSVNTSSWFWKLSDGQTSTEQNPVFTINSIDPIEVILTATSSEGCQDDDIQVIDVITGIEDPKLTGALKLYPNPASGIINVEFTNEYYGTFDINIYNTVGKTVRKMKIPKNGKYSHNAIDLNGLPKGLYLIKVDLDSFGQSTSRILLR
jgi:subtilisin family serine protease